MEREDACVNTEEGFPAQHLHVPIREVQGTVRGYASRVGGRLIIGRIWDREIGQSGDADRRGLGHGR